MNFDEKEAAFLLSTKINDVILEALELADIPNDLRRLMRLYSDRRAALTANLPVEAMEGTLADTTLSNEETQRLIPQMTPLNSIFQAMASKIDQDYLQAQVFDALRAYCGLRFGAEFPNLEINDPQMPNARGVGTIQNRQFRDTDRRPVIGQTRTPGETAGGCLNSR